MTHTDIVTFKKGDLIERTEGTFDTNSFVTKGKVYRVTEDSDNLSVKIIDDRLTNSLYNVQYFKLSKNHIVKQIIQDL